MIRRSALPEDGFLRFVIDVLVNSVVIIALFFFVQKVIAAPFQVIGNSMYDTLHDGEYIVVSKLEYLFGEPQRGDIVVFHPPHHTDEYYIKRVVGIPGDKVELKAGSVFVNGAEVHEGYLREDMKTCLVAHMRNCENDERAYEVPEGKYFVLGDNRSGSSDSRAWYDADNKPDPFVDRDQIQGKTRVVLYPLPEIRLIPETTVFDAVGE
jgi:signal peptidase I